MFPWSVTHVNDSGFPVFERGKRAKHSTGYRGTGRPSGQLKDDKSVVKEARRVNKDPRQRLRSRKLRSAQCPEHTLGSLPPRPPHQARQRHNWDHDKGPTPRLAVSPRQSTAHHQRDGRAYGEGSNKASQGRRGLYHRPAAEGRRVTNSNATRERRRTRRTTTPTTRRPRPYVAHRAPTSLGASRTPGSPLPSVTTKQRHRQDCTRPAVRPELFWPR